MLVETVGTLTTYWWLYHLL